MTAGLVVRSGPPEADAAATGPVRVLVDPARWRSALAGARGPGSAAPHPDPTQTLLDTAATVLGGATGVAVHARVRLRWGRVVVVTELALARDLRLAAGVRRAGLATSAGVRVGGRGAVTVGGGDALADLAVAAVPAPARRRPAGAPDPDDPVAAVDLCVWGPGAPGVLVDAWVQDRAGWARRRDGGWEPVDGRDLRAMLATALATLAATPPGTWVETRAETRVPGRA